MQKIPWDIYKINTLLLSLVLEYFFRTTSPGGVCSLRPPLQVGEYFYSHLLQVGSLASPGPPLPLLPVLTRHYRELAGYVEFLFHFIGWSHPYAGHGAYGEANSMQSLV